MSDDLQVWPGSRLDVLLTVVDDTGAPFPLVSGGYTAAAMQARTSVGSATILLDLSTANGAIKIEPGGATGQVHIHAGADLTAAVTTQGVYDCIAWNPADLTDVIIVAPLGSVIPMGKVTPSP